VIINYTSEGSGNPNSIVDIVKLNIFQILNLKRHEFRWCLSTSKKN